jgi:hypothetical protein
MEKGRVIAEAAGIPLPTISAIDNREFCYSSRGISYEMESSSAFPGVDIEACDMAATMQVKVDFGGEAACEAAL